MRSRGLAEVSEQTTVEQVGERRLERVNQTEESRRPDLPLPALNAAHPYGRMFRKRGESNNYMRWLTITLPPCRIYLWW